VKGEIMDTKLYDSCNNKKCPANFDGECRQPYLNCFLHMTIGTSQQKALEERLKAEGKDFYKEYKKHINS
jgi:hypothetical protein